MTNEELQKLKDLAIAAGGDDWDFDTAETPIRIAGGEVVGGDALPYGDVYTMRDYEQLDEDGEPVSEPLTICSEIGAQFGRFIARASPAVVLELIALAERAVSPAGEAGIVDDPDEPNLRGLLHELVNAFGPKFDRTMNAIFGKFIAYGQKQLEHGRRSALEELHPQWLKEKERADRAEAAADDARARAYHLANRLEDANGAQPLQQEGGKDAKPIEKERADFEEWYTTHAFDYEAAPIGSRDCALQWSAWLARSGGCYSAPSDWKVSPMPWGISDNLQQASTTDGPLKQFLKAAEDAGITHLNFKQATPEGADLPEAARQNGGVVRAALIDLMAAVEPSALSGARDFKQQSEFRVLFARARAALAANAAAEPVMYVRLRDINGTFTNDMVTGYRTPGSDWNVALYRAAPPQQVDTNGLPG